MAEGDLITPGEYTAAAPPLSAGEAARLPAAIAAASAAISKRYPLAAVTRTWDETHDPGELGTIQLGCRPVKSVLRLRADLATVLTITYTGSGRRGMVETDADLDATPKLPTALTLSVETNGITAITAALDFLTYPTLGTLAAAVAQLGGWTAGVADLQADMPSADLEPDPGIRPAKGGGCRLKAYTRDPDDYTIDRNRGEITFAPMTCSQFARVIYTAGPATAPADVKRACITTVQEMIAQLTRPAGAIAETSDDYSYRLSDPALAAAGCVLPTAAEKLLSRYKQRSF